MPTLTVVMIVKNESRWLRPCLESVQSIADTIIIGDTGSTDDTRAIAEDFGAEIIDVPWTDDFAAARNAVLAHAQGDWLLQIDADEEIDTEGARLIREAVDADGDGADAFEVIQANYCGDARAWRWTACAPDDNAARGHAGYIAVPIIRLFRAGRGFEYREAIHENLTESIRERGGVIRALDVRIHHYGYAEEGPARDEKIRRYAAICERKVGERPDDAKAWYDLAEQRAALGEDAAAEDAAHRAVALAPTNIDAVTCLAKLLLNRGALDEARALLEVEGERPAHYDTALGAVAIRQGRNDDAIAHLTRAVAKAPRDPVALTTYARALDVVGDREKADSILADALTIAGTIDAFAAMGRAREARDAGEQAFGAGDAQQALAHFVAALRDDPDDPITHSNLGVVCAALGKIDSARESLQRALTLAPGLEDAKVNLSALED